jgi:hypothetical protein
MNWHLARTRVSTVGGRKRGVERNHGVCEIPLLLLTESFSEAWQEWVEYRIEAGKQMGWVTNDRVFQKSMNKCEKWGIERSVAAIDFSIEMGYRGLYEPRKIVTSPKSPSSKKPDKWEGL